MTTFEAKVPLGHRGWGTEESMMKTTDELLVVYSVYKRENDRKVDGATFGEVWAQGLECHASEVRE